MFTHTPSPEFWTCARLKMHAIKTVGLLCEYTVTYVYTVITGQTKDESTFQIEACNPFFLYGIGNIKFFVVLGV